jgi:hypothetical protein
MATVCLLGLACSVPNVGMPPERLAQELGPSQVLSYKYYFPGRKPTMHPSGLGSIHTELVDGVDTGTRNTNCEDWSYPV